MNYKKVLFLFATNLVVFIIWYALGAFFWMSWDISKWDEPILRILWSLFLIIPMCVATCSINSIKEWFE